MQRRSGWVWAAGLVFSAGCAVTEPAEQQSSQAAGSGPSGGPCPDEVCGSNSPVIDKIGFHELNLQGLRNVQGFSTVTGRAGAQIVQGGVSYDLHIVGGVITGTRRGLPTLAGEDLVKASIPIQRGAAQYVLVIEGVRTMTYYAAPRDALEVYTLGWHAIGQDTDTPLCDNIQGLIDDRRRDPEGAAEELLGMAEVESVVFEGDRVDTGPKTMSQVADDTWFNIGCAGATLSKLRLTRNTVHSQDPAMARAWEQRQATLKMYVADYCGTGDIFTVHGQKLVWQGGGMAYLHMPRSLEARWTEAGAACLDNPRMLHPTTALGAMKYPDIAKQISKVCTLKQCGVPDPLAYDGADRVSGNPTF